MKATDLINILSTEIKKNGDFEIKDQRDWSKFKPNKPKFDPNTLQPFDKVLVRDNNSEKWCCELFSNIDNVETFPYICVSGSYKMAISYNEDTKHLVGTTEEAPEFYRYWED